MNKEKDVLSFGNRRIRRVWHKDDWHYSVVDAVGALIESKDIRQYVNKMRQRDELLREGWVQIVHPLSIETKGGKQMINCANLKGIFRIIQSIPSRKAEPFKMWLAPLDSLRHQAGQAKVESEKIGRNSNVYKFVYCDSRDMLPGDLHGSPDESFFLEVSYG